MVAMTAFAQDLVPGTGVTTPGYDVSHGGWDSEQFAADAGVAFDRLKQVIVESSATSQTPFTTSTFLGAPLRPKSMSISYEDASLRVKRCGRIEPTLALGKAVGSLTSTLDVSETPHLKIKITQASLEKDARVTLCEVRFDGLQKDGSRLQLSQHWECRWRIIKGVLLLDRLTLLDGEESLTMAGRSTALLADITESVLGGQTAYRDHLAYGLDHWLARLDSRVGLKVGGWNGLAVGDANNDGLEDVYLCQSGGLPNRLFLRQRDGSAVETAEKAGVDWLETARGALFIDLDNDGDQDLVAALSQGVMIQENDGRGHFTVKSAELLPFAVPYSLAAADYDDDGDLDIFAACYERRGHVDRNTELARPVPYHDANNGGRNALLRNEGGFKFRHVTKQLGLDENNTRYSYAATWADYDGDGDLDLYVANDFGRNNLFRQDRSRGRIRFVDVAEVSGVLDIAAGMSASWGDFDNDGRLDLYVSNMFSSAGNRIATRDRFMPSADDETRQLFLRHARGNSLFKNTGQGFEDVSVSAGVTQGRWAWGSLFTDLNNDGWEDIVVANGFITQEDTGDL